MSPPANWGTCFAKLWNKTAIDGFKVKNAAQAANLPVSAVKPATLSPGSILCTCSASAPGNEIPCETTS